jgi:mono/diheme cytochrome c family protein
MRGLWMLLVAAGAATSAPAQQESGSADLESFRSRVRPFMAAHCASCHGAKKTEGELNLETLDPDMKSSTSAARWAVVVDKLVTGEMPPKEKVRPAEAETAAVVAWVHAEMKRAGKRIARRKAYDNGNAIPHRLLFDPASEAPFDAAARVRRPSPEIYAAFLNDLSKGARGVVQPFSPEVRTTFRDMGAARLDEPTTALLIQNALVMVEQQTAYRIEDGKLKAVGSTSPEFLALLDEANPATDPRIEAALKVQFDRVLKRRPTPDELSRFTALMHRNIRDAGRTTGVRTTLAAVLLLPEAVFRWELGAGTADGRARLSPRETAFALAFALTDRRPETWLLAEADQGGLGTREAVERAARRMLDDPKLEKPRILRFFREYFGYERAKEVFKNDADNREHDALAIVDDADRLVEHVLGQDKNVLFELLTTNKSFVGARTAADTKKKRAEAIAKFEAERRKDPEKFKTKTPPKVGRNLYEAYNLPDFPEQQPVELPVGERAGILTQPAWLVAWSQSTDNDAIRRGKWIRERLLGGVVPDIPITVDAQLPDAPEKSLRERMNVLRDPYCWQCHRLMNPLGLTLEIYDHFGRYRKAEMVLDREATSKNVDPKGKPKGPLLRPLPVDSSGSVSEVGDGRIERAFPNALEMLNALATSERVEQVFVRHAFRYWMGRNETLGDAPTLRAAHLAYRDSGGSMKALIASLLSSDSFLYRIPSAKSSDR